MTSKSSVERLLGMSLRGVHCDYELQAALDQGSLPFSRDGVEWDTKLEEVASSYLESKRALRIAAQRAEEYLVALAKQEPTPGKQ